MAKRGRRPGKRGRQARQHQHGRQVRQARTHQASPGDLLADVRQRLASGEPLDLLAYVSTLLAAVNPRGESPFERARADGPERTTLPTLLESFAEVVQPETTALLATLAELGPDELTRARAPRPWRRGRINCRAGSPARRPSVCKAVESTHVLGDGDRCCLARGCRDMS